MTKIIMYPAGNGDAFLIEHERTTILIDGGYSLSFQQHVLSDLVRYATQGKALDLVVSTHIDSDHIAGLVKFFDLNGAADSPKIIRVNQVWHNSLCSLALTHPPSPELSSADLELLYEICRRGYATAAGDQQFESEIGARQGSSLASLLRKGRFNWNNSIGSQPIVAPLHVELNDDVSIDVLGPTPQRLLELRNLWIGEIRRTGIAGTLSMNPMLEDAFEFLCSHAKSGRDLAPEMISRRSDKVQVLADIYEPDDSVPNGSSISFIIQAGSNRFLFLGDAGAEDITSALTKFQPSKTPLMFDAIKISHHGSFRNTSPEFLRWVDSPRFLISTNGDRHNHPDIEVLKAIVDRPSSFTRNMYFNFHTFASSALRQYASSSQSAFTVHENVKEIQVT